MPAIALKTSKTSTLIIKRVLRQGQRFLCGVCREYYDDKTEAEDCLTNCLRQRVKGIAVKTVDHLGTPYYRCELCCREYDSEEKALDCSSECKASLHKFILEREEEIKLVRGYVPVKVDMQVKPGDRAASSLAENSSKKKKSKKNSEATTSASKTSHSSPEDDIDENIDDLDFT